MQFNRWLRQHLQWVLILVLVSVSAGDLAAQPAQPLDSDAIDSFVESQLQAHRIPGLALAITQGDEIVHLRGYGTAGDGRPMTPDTPLHLGSVSKSFTALAIMQLVEQGQVDLDAPVQTYLPWFTLADDVAARAITVRHLLHHTSGLSDLEYVPTFPDDTTLQQAVEDLDRVEPTAAPGEEFYYFNQNYSTLGLIVETVSDQPYGEYVQEHIFAPLGMEQSAAQTAAIAGPDLAQGHNTFFGFPIAREQEVADYWMPEGGIVSSAEDMAHYLIAQNNGGLYDGERVLSEEGITAMHTPGSGTDGAYAMGWDIGEYKGRSLVFHGGLMENFLADVTLLPEQDYGTAILINQSGLLPKMVALPQLQAGIQDALTGAEPAGGMALSTVYWIVIAVVLITIFFDIRWWRVNFPAWRRQAPEMSNRALFLGVAREFVWPAVLFFGVPALLTALEGGRGIPWGRMFGVAPDLSLLLWYGILMGVAKGLAKAWMVWRQRRPTLSIDARGRAVEAFRHE